MLLEFSCSNHKSIKEKVTFSALAGKDNTFESSLKQFGDYRILRTAVLYGANGSGKSNFVNAFLFVRSLVISSINLQPGQEIRQSVHKLSRPDSESEYCIQFVKNGIRYAFGFVLKQHLIKSEYLYYFPLGRQVRIYERDENTFYPGNKFKGKFEACKDVFKQNRLFLSCAANFSNVVPVSEAYDFFLNDIVVYIASNSMNDASANWMQYSLRQIHDDPKVKKLVLSLLRLLNTGIKDVKIKIEERPLQMMESAQTPSDEVKATLRTDFSTQIDAKVIYDSFEVDLKREESLGIKKLFEMLCPMIDILIHGKILVCDELESNLHEALVHGLIRLFCHLGSDQFAQLIFTTHDTTLLDLNLFRRDQIWFTELTKDTRATELYSLAEIKNVRKDENIEKGYICGKYGAIPMLNSELANFMAEL